MSNTDNLQDLDKVFEALANKHRREIIEVFSLQPCSISKLASMRGLSLPAIYKHIKVLENADMIIRQKIGRTNFLTLNRKSLRALQEWIMPQAARSTFRGCLQDLETNNSEKEIRTMSNNSAVNVIRGQYSQMQGWLEGTMDGVTDELAHFDPPGLVMPIGAQFAHIVTGLDFFVLGLAAGKQPLLTGSFADKSGMSEAPPNGGGFAEWAEKVKVDLSALDAYSKAVFAEVDSYLASLTDEALHEEKEFGGAGNQTVLWALNIIMLNTYSHTGEISAIKGMKGLKGYPF